ncbi:MAG: hypothetical protein ACOQNV_00570 [Mycoplasmoidaceae bacterium]
MTDAILTALVIIFICFLCAGLIVYTIFFAIHKKYFRQQLNIVKKFNELINGLNGINIYKIQVLANNDLGEKLDLNKYIDIYKKLKENSIVIRSNISISESELNSFNLKVAKKYIHAIDKDLTKALSDFNDLQTAYIGYTQYGQAIETTFQNYLEIYERLALFYETKLDYNLNFNRVNSLFASIRKTLENIPKLSIKFDYKRTIDTVLDLGRKLRTLADAILLVYRFQIIDTYLKTSKEVNEKMIKDHYAEISSSDLQALQNLLTIFNHAYNNFNRHYRILDLGKAAQFSIQAINAINQVNQFTYIHINTPTLINLSVSEIKDQTDKILANKNDIVNSIRDLKQYFVLEPEILDCFEVIEKDINRISSLSNTASHITYRTHTEKIRAVKDLDSIANQIINRKLEIVQAIDKIDDMLAKVIKTVTDLNDLYIYFWQLLTIVKQLAPNDDESESIRTLIESNLKQIEQYSKQIVSDKKPDFDKIAYELSTIVEQSQQIYKQMTTTIVLKTYATKLLTYVNRYKSIKQLKDSFADANKLFKDKKYSQCIDKLLVISRNAKKYKN